MFAALTARLHVASPGTTILARYGKRVVKNEESEESTGFAQMIIRVQEEDVIPLLRNSGKNGLFVRQTHRTSQDPSQLEALGVGENYVIWMPMDHMLMETQKASADLPEYMGLAWRLQWNKQVRLGVRVGAAGLEEARKRFHDQDERFNDSNRGVPVRTTWAIGPIPYSTTPLQLASALWNWSGGVGMPWKVIPIRVLPSKGDRGVGQTWLVGAERSPPALELTLSSGKVFIRAETTGPRRSRTDVWDKIKQQRDQHQGGASEIDPWLNKTTQSTTPAIQKNPWQSWRGTGASDRLVEMQVQQDQPQPVNIMEMVEKKCEEIKREMRAEVETIRE